MRDQANSWVALGIAPTFPGMKGADITLGYSLAEGDD